MNPLTDADRPMLEAAIAAGDVRVLLMVLFHMTGDESWLLPPYQPKRDVRLIPDPNAGLPEPLQAEIRRAAVEALLARREPAITDPGDALVARMMSVCLGETVAPEYAPLNREEMGLIPRGVQWRAAPPARMSGRNVLIVGAGICGIALAQSLKELGIPFTIVEQSGCVGGTWNRNRYPGCGVDTPNHSYSFSFGQRYSWSQYFSKREEILDYLNGIVDEFGLREHIMFGTRLTGSAWCEERRCWVSTLQTGLEPREFASAILVTAIGQLSDPSIPRIEGQGSFRGPIFHSSDWSEGLEIAGKRLVVIGTGATAMQLVPTIADSAANVAVFQRTPQWSRPIPGYADMIGRGTQWLLKHLPYYAEWFRFNMFWRYGDGLLPFLRKDADWPEQDRSVNRINDRHRQEMINFIHAELGDREDLIAKCVPSYPPYGKRILLDNGWYRTLLKPNVELIDQTIRRITPEGIETADGVLRKADVIVYSTGFRLTEMAARLGIVGREGRTLATEWANDNPTAYLGLVVPGFPNMFGMLGPGSGPAHGGSVMFQAECQARYVSACIVAMAEQKVDAIDVRQEVHDRYTERLDAEHETLIWTHPGMSTYYRNTSGRVFSVMPWRFVDYWSMTHDPDLSEYELTRSEAEPSPGGMEPVLAADVEP